MSFLDSLTGGAYQRANKNNQYAILTGMNQASTSLMDTTQDANDYLLNQGLGALSTGYNAAQGHLGAGYAASRTDTAAGYGSGRDALGASYGQAADALNSGYGAAINSLGQGRSDLLNQYGVARGDINSNYDRARGDLGTQYAETQGYLGRVTDSYQPMIAGGRGAFDRYMDATGAAGAEGSERATQNFRAAPGYQFQTDQALGAIQRSAAARGGLAGGNATRDILTAATGLADQSYQNYVGNLLNGSQFYTTGLAGQERGLTAQANASQSYGNSLATLGMRQGDQLANISTGLGNQLAANSTSAAGIYQNQGNALGNLYQNQGNLLNTSHIGEGTGLAGLDSNYGLNSANLSTGLAGQQLGTYGQVGSNLTGLGRNEAGLIQNMTQLMTDSNNQQAKGETQASSNLLGTIAGIINSPLTGKITGKLFG